MVPVSFTPTPVVVPAVPTVPAVPAVPVTPVPLVLAPTPAFAPIALEPVLDCVLLGAVPAAAPLTPPVVPGVLLADGGVDVEVWPAMFALPAVLLCGALDGFSVVDGFTDALAPVFAVPVWFAVPEAVLLAVPCVFRVPLALLLALGALPLTPALAVPVWLLTLPLAVADGDVELL